MTLYPSLYQNMSLMANSLASFKTCLSAARTKSRGKLAQIEHLFCVTGLLSLFRGNQVVMQYVRCNLSYIISNTVWPGQNFCRTNSCIYIIETPLRHATPTSCAKIWRPCIISLVTRYVTRLKSISSPGVY